MELNTTCLTIVLYLKFEDKKIGDLRVDSNGGVPEGLGSRDRSHSIQLTKQS